MTITIAILFVLALIIYVVVTYSNIDLFAEKNVSMTLVSVVMGVFPVLHLYIFFKYSLKRRLLRLKNKLSNIKVSTIRDLENEIINNESDE